MCFKTVDIIDNKIGIVEFFYFYGTVCNLRQKLKNKNRSKFLKFCFKPMDLDPPSLENSVSEQIHRSAAAKATTNTCEKSSINQSVLNFLGFFHRDLTSKNILVKKEGERLTAIVGDFGLATRIPSKSSPRLPQVLFCAHALFLPSSIPIRA
jgi:hypothetical protein